MLEVKKQIWLSTMSSDAEGAVRAQAKKHSVGRHVGNLACARSRGNGAPPLMASRFASITCHRVGIGFPSFDTLRISWVSGKTNCVTGLHEDKALIR
jgi:hypothetical protein